MRFHVLALPHSQTTYEYNLDAYQMKVVKFCNMMTSLGHEVFLYASEENEANCTELITCITKIDQEKYLNGLNYVYAPYDSSSTLWKTFNNKAVNEIAKRKKHKDFLCIIGGVTQKPVADAHPDLMAVEWGVGYEGVFSKYKVFESYAWMHTIYGKLYGGHSANGNFYDTVIPNFFDVSKFPFEQKRGNYYLFIGRLIERKGLAIAQEACKRAQKRLLVAGLGNFSGYGEYLGTLNEQERSEYMSKAKATFAPTLYIEPFGAVVTEAQLCGTPVISTDWGAFTETIEQNKTGARCHTLKEFISAMDAKYDYGYIRDRAKKLWSMEVVKYKYQDYFDRLYELWGDGWYSI